MGSRSGSGRLFNTQPGLACAAMSAGAAVAAAEARRATAAKEKRKRDLEARREKDREAKEAGLQATDIYSGAKALVAKARAEKERLERVKLNLPEKDQIFGLEGLVREPPTDRVKGPSGRLYANASLWCMQVHHQPRKAAIYMVESSWFDPLILVTILANCFTMAWESPMDPTGTVKEAFIDVSAAHTPPAP